MIPSEVAAIAEELALHYKGSVADKERFISLAWKIYNRLQVEAQDYCSKSYP